MRRSPNYSLCKLFCWVLLSWAARAECANILYPSSQCENKSVSHSVLSYSATAWTLISQAPLSIGFSRQECWIGLPFSSPGDLPNPGIEPRSPALQGDSLPAEPPGKPRGFDLCSVTADPSKRHIMIIA